MSLSFSRVGKCGQSEREFLMGIIEDKNSEIIGLKADRIRDKAEIKRLKEALWAARRNHDGGRSYGTQAVDVASNGTGKNART